MEEVMFTVPGEPRVPGVAVLGRALTALLLCGSTALAQDEVQILRAQEEAQLLRVFNRNMKRASLPEGRCAQVNEEMQVRHLSDGLSGSDLQTALKLSISVTAAELTQSPFNMRVVAVHRTPSPKAALKLGRLLLKKEHGLDAIVKITVNTLVAAKHTPLQIPGTSLAFAYERVIKVQELGGKPVATVTLIAVVGRQVFRVEMLTPSAERKLAKGLLRGAIRALTSTPRPRGSSARGRRG
jgi:hypothetical protein